VDKTSPASAHRASACSLVPDTARHQSSAYVDRRIMSTLWLEGLVAALVVGWLVGIISVMI
jgi:hypothetical protein